MPAPVIPAFSTLVGSVGVGLLLVAFFANLFGWLDATRRLYPAMNLVGGALSCWASWLIGFLPFVVLEGTWALVAAVALLQPRRAVGAHR
jgi:hypothetical protein